MYPGAQSAKHGLHIPPLQIASGLSVEDGLKGPPVYLSHDIMISYPDVVNKSRSLVAKVLGVICRKGDRPATVDEEGEGAGS